MSNTWIGKVLITRDTIIYDDTGKAIFSLAHCDGSRYDPLVYPFLAANTDIVDIKFEYDTRTLIEKTFTEEVFVSKFGWGVTASVNGKIKIYKGLENEPIEIDCPPWRTEADSADIIAGTNRCSYFYLPTTNTTIIRIHKETLRVDILDAEGTGMQKVTAAIHNDVEIVMGFNSAGSGKMFKNGEIIRVVDASAIASCDELFFKSSTRYSPDGGETWILTDLPKYNFIGVSLIKETITIYSPEIEGGGLWSDDGFLTTHNLDIADGLSERPLLLELPDGSFIIPGKKLYQTLDGKTFQEIPKLFTEAEGAGIDFVKKHLTIKSENNYTVGNVVFSERYRALPNMQDLSPEHPYKIIVDLV